MRRLIQLAVILLVVPVAMPDEATSGMSSTACCIDTICIPDFTAAQCYDNGGVWLGTGSNCSDALANGFCVNPPMCKPGSEQDQDGVSCGQPFPDPFNSGCLQPSQPFQFLPTLEGCGAVVCGQSSADDRGMNNRDTDWFFITSLETTQYTACVTAQFFPEVQFWLLNPGVDPCLGAVPATRATGNPGVAVCATDCLLGGNPYAIVVSTADPNGNPQRQGVGCTDYVLEVSCDDCPMGACCGADNVCAMNVSEPDCVAGGGEYLGDGETCAGVACGGACCLPDGSCFDSASRDQCLSGFGGAYNGFDSLCADVEPCELCSFEDPLDRDGLEGVDEDCTILGVDVVNGGCTSGASGLDFTSIQCGETVCGSTAYDGSTRDLDWYHFTVASETEVVFEVENQMIGARSLVFQLQWRDPDDPNTQFCGDGVSLISPQTGNALPAGKSFFSAVLSPARYTLIVTYDFNNSPALPPNCPEETRYRLSVECNVPCTFTCVDTEGEPDCGLANEINPGCSMNPAGAFSPLTLSADWVCGSTRLVQVDDGMGNVDVRRDVDWWRFTMPFATDFVFEFEAEFEAVVVLQPIGSGTDCDLPPVFAKRVTQCEELSINIPDLSAGEYAVFVAPALDAYTWFLDPPAEEVCGSAYRLRACNCVIEPPCFNALCGDANCDGAITVSDIGFFVIAIANGEAAWNAQFPGGAAPCEFCVNDTNGDGFVTVSDIGPFVNAVTNGGCQ